MFHIDFTISLFPIYLPIVGFILTLFSQTTIRHFLTRQNWHCNCFHRFEIFSQGGIYLEIVFTNFKYPHRAEFILKLFSHIWNLFTARNLSWSSIHTPWFEISSQGGNNWLPADVLASRLHLMISYLIISLVGAWYSMWYELSCRNHHCLLPCFFKYKIKHHSSCSLLLSFSPEYLCTERGIGFWLGSSCC